MSLPTPQHPLDDACSCLYNNTLYSYTPEAFQSLALEQGSEWVQLPMGTPVANSVCVKAIPNDADAALYIVGGTSNSAAYQGIQRYMFAEGKWESLSPTANVTQNRLYHGAVYLNASKSILVYGGVQDDSNQGSSQTFTMETSPPYYVSSYPAPAPIAKSPLLLPWSDSEALYIGGSNTNKKAMIFNPATSWIDSNATLADPIYDTSAIKAIVVDGTDSSKSVYTFDMTVSPNMVNRTILIDGEGKPVANSKPIVSRELRIISRESAETEDLTIAGWPSYNGSLAPSSVRTSYSVASDQSGLVVISGGNAQEPLAMFNANENSWVNSSARLVSPSSAQQVLTTSVATTSSSPTAATSSSQTAAAAPTTSSSSDLLPVKILGAVLGSILGVALILLAILMLLKWRRKRRQYDDAGHQRRSSGIPEEKDMIDLPPTSSTRQFRSHEPQASQASFSSMAILMGRVGGHRRGSDKGNGSLESNSSSQFNKKYKSAISKPIPQERVFEAHVTPPTPGFAPERPTRSDHPPADRGSASRPRGNSRGAKRGSTRRSSGWNGYWSGASALNVLGLGGSKRTTYGSEDSASQYSDHRPSRVTQDSATIPPLRLNGQAEMNRVNSGSPTVAHFSDKFPLSREMSGTIERPTSTGTASSYEDDDLRDAYSSGVPESVHELAHHGWDPVERNDWAAPKANNAIDQYAASLPRSTPREHPTEFPKEAEPAAPPRPQVSDMSWLNLGNDSHV